ncbi:hypothetical protein TorRG33x02_185280 [Trema orientale]|uniref:Uncharacterized protein n=1 Tax=Trema orientale TaxID=63057 RepID=A0A2P5EJJ0_TREOI|nr:hypothetical protein TorRG33x02_185280 [Trema orientale]
MERGRAEAAMENDGLSRESFSLSLSFLVFRFGYNRSVTRRPRLQLGYNKGPSLTHLHTLGRLLSVRSNHHQSTPLLDDPPSRPLAPPRIHFRAPPQTADAVAPPPSTTPAQNRYRPRVQLRTGASKQSRTIIPILVNTFRHLIFESNVYQV